MSKILITGNGFDLFHHLPTKYGHFMAIMMTIEDCNFSGRIGFEDLFGRIFKKKFFNDYNLIAENYKIENIVFDESKIKEIKEKLKENKWYHHFKNILNLKTWIDFETEIENVLDDFSAIFTYIRKNPDNYNIYEKAKVNIYNNHFAFGFSESSIGDLMSVNKNYLDIPNKKIKEKDFFQILSKELQEFIIIFNKYLIDITYIFYNHLRKRYNIPFDKINEIYTVNYTPTIEKIYNIDKSKIKYLHGETNENSSLQNLVLGVSDLNEVVKFLKIFDFSKYFQKIYKNSNPRLFNSINKIKDIAKSKYTSESVQFYIIGHSLDKSDEYLLKKIFKILEYDSLKRTKLCVFYYDVNDKNTKLNNLLCIFEKNLIVKLNSQDRLVFKLLNEENISEEFSKEISNEIYI